jgi:phosphonate transport system substrate-binding protein
VKKFALCLFFFFIFSSSYAQSNKIVYATSILGRDSIAAYSELTSYIGEKLKMPLIPVFENDRSIASKMVAFKEAQFGFLCSGPYIIGKEHYNFEILAAIKPAFGKEYRSYIIVPSDSTASSLSDLKGKSFAFVDLQAYTGRLVPLYMLIQKGYDPKTFFSDMKLTKSHENSMYDVAEKKVAGASVMSLVFDYIASKDQKTVSKIKIIDKSEKTGFPVFVISKYAAPDIKEKIRNVLVNMDHDPKGKAVLKKLQLDSFYVPKEEEYALIKKQVETLKDYIP